MLSGLTRRSLSGLKPGVLPALLISVGFALSGCWGISEIDQCNDGIDNDGDGMIDMFDEGCPFNGKRESPNPVQCNDGVDNDEDGFVDGDDPGCTAALDDTEFHIPNPTCLDGIDNDEDGLTDYPFDPGCFLPLDDSEEDGCVDGSAPCPPCSDGIDNDNDDLLDFPADPGCTHAAALDEYDLALNVCGGDLIVTEFPELMNEAAGTIIPAAESVTESLQCGGDASGETVWALLVRQPSTVVLTTAHPTTTADTIIYLREACLDPTSEMACNDNESEFTNTSRIQVDIPDPGYYFLFVDSVSGQSGGFRVRAEYYTITGELCDPDFPACAPGVACRPINDGAIEHRCLKPACEDGIDNDGDGFIDYPAEPGCSAGADDSELDDCPGPTCPECSDGADNDADGLTDFAEDRIGCATGMDNSEADECFAGIPILPYPPGGVNTEVAGPPVYKGSCTFGTTGREDIYGIPVQTDLEALVLDSLDSLDDMVMYVRTGDCHEANSEIVCAEATSRGELITLENPDRGVYYVFIDGFSSFHTEYVLNVEGIIKPGADCIPGDTVMHCSEGFACDMATQTCEPARCINMVDDDSDGLTDWPDDPGCESINDHEEDDTCPNPPNCAQCSNEIDDDEDGAIDFGEDIGCEFAGDGDEIDDCVPDVEPMPLSDAGITGTTPQSGAAITPSCSTSTTSPEDVYYYILSRDLSSLTFSTEGSPEDTVVSVRYGVCGDIQAELGCENTPGGGERVTIENPAHGVYYPMVDGNLAASVDYMLNVSGTLALGQACDPADMQFTCEPGFTCDSGSMTCVNADCSNGVDDDGDGKLDFPFDPGCESKSDGDEMDDCPGGPGCPQCSNGADDDTDMATDFPNDVGCESANDNDEGDVCIPGVSFLPLTDAGASGMTPPNATGSNFQPSCHPSPSSTEVVYAYGLFRNMEDLTFSTVGSAGDTVLTVRYGECDGVAAELGCRNDQNGGERIRVDNPELGVYYINIDGDYVSGIPYDLSVSGTLSVGESCTVGDMQFVCADGSFCDGGTNTCVATQCSDGINNGDGDMVMDYPNDPGCSDINDDDESDPCPGAGCPECSDDVDNDADGQTDYPTDYGCAFAGETSEGDCDIESDPVEVLADASVSGTTVGLNDDHTLSCGSGAGAPDKSFLITVPGNMLSMTVTSSASSFDTVLSVKSPSCDVPAELSCDDDGGLGNLSQVKLSNVAAGQYAIILDGKNGAEGPYQVNISGAILQGQPCDPAQVSAGMFVCANGTSCTDMGGGFMCQ